MVLTVSFVISPVTGLCCHRHQRFTRELDASIGASGPHDFAVRVSIVRRAHQARPTLPRPSHPARLTSVTIASRPSCGRETGELVELICPTMEAKYFSEQVWTDFLICPSERVARR
jgi:hypothetical protein